MNKEMFRWYKILKYYGQPEFMSHRMIIYHTLVHNFDINQRMAIARKAGVLSDLLDDKIIFTKIPKDVAQKLAGKIKEQVQTESKKPTYIS